MGHKKQHTARIRFLQGMARVLDIGATMQSDPRRYYKQRSVGEALQADARALAGDAKRVMQKHYPINEAAE